MNQSNEPGGPPPFTPPPHQESPHQQSSAGAAGISAEQRQWAMFAHLSALLGFIIPFGNIIGPLVIWLVKKDEMPFVDDQGKESLNFQITVAVAALISMALIVVLIGIPLLVLVAIGALVMTVLAAIKANEGTSYRYPFTLRLIK